jgi:uncharacterized protein YjbI with pentapeptide repeats
MVKRIIRITEGGSKMEQEDLGDKPYDDDDDVEYPELSFADLEKLASGKPQRLFIEEVSVTDFSAVVAWAEQRKMAIEMENCMLYGTKVPGTLIDMSFDNVIFMERLLCANGTFAGQLSFYETSFSRAVDFRSAVFEKDVIFDDCDFGGKVTLEGSHFKRDVCFTYSEFDGRAVFDGAKFEGRVDFSRAEFRKPASFKEAFFEKGANLRKTDFEQGVDKTGSNIDETGREKSPFLEEADPDVS